MKEPRRLVESDAPELTVSLLSAWAEQHPTARARAQTARAIGLMTLAAAATKAAGVGAAAGSAPGAGVAGAAGTSGAVGSAPAAGVAGTSGAVGSAPAAGAAGGAGTSGAVGSAGVAGGLTAAVASGAGGGAGSAGAGGLSAAAAVTGAGGAAIGTAAGSTAGLLAKGLLVKWLAGGLLVGSVATVTVSEIANPVLQEPSAGSASASAKPPQPSGASRRFAPPVPADEDERVQEVSGSPGSEASLEARPTTVASQRRGSRSAAAPALPGIDTESNSDSAPTTGVASSLTREVAAIERARRALASRDARGALAALDEYHAIKSSGALDPEAALLSIDSAELEGDYARAAQLAKRHLASYPRTPHGARLRQLIARGEGEPSGSPP